MAWYDHVKHTREKMPKPNVDLPQRRIEPAIFLNQRARLNAAFHLNETLANQRPPLGPVHERKHEITCTLRARRSKTFWTWKKLGFM